MSTAQHTPGPWQVEARKGETWVCRSDSAVLARLGAAKEIRANARLIAAAPELLEAVRALMSDIEQGADPSDKQCQRVSGSWGKALAAIARATGATP